MRVRSFCYAAATALVCAASSATATVIDVSINGTTSGQNAGGPYAISGGFSFNTLAPGATSNLNDVNILDPGLFDFSVAFAGGAFDTTFSDPLEPVVNLGFFNLSNFVTLPDIVNTNICLQMPGSDGQCNSGSPGGVLTFNSFGAIGFSPDQSNGIAQADGFFGI